MLTVRRISLAELARLGITKPKIECTADPVLAIHPVDKAAGRAIFKRYHADGAEPVVGISVRNWQHETHFKDVMAEVSDRIVRELGARVVFLPMQFPEDVHAAESIAACNARALQRCSRSYADDAFSSPASATWT